MRNTPRRPHSVQTAYRSIASRVAVLATRSLTLTISTTQAILLVESLDIAARLRKAPYADSY